MINIKKYITILILGILVFNLIGCKQKENPLDELDETIPNIKETITERQETSRLEGSIFYVDNQGNIKNEEHKIDSDKPYNQYVDDILKKYEKHEKVTLPSNVEVENVYIDFGTLYLSFNENIKNIKFDNLEEQKKFIESLIQSVLSISDKNFTDVQFLINGNVERYVFGNGYETDKPLKR